MPDFVTDRELHAHLERIGDYMESTDRRLSRIEDRLDARPALRWMKGRVTQLIDHGLPLGLVFAGGFLIAHFH